MLPHPATYRHTPQLQTESLPGPRDSPWVSVVGGSVGIYLSFLAGRGLHQYVESRQSAKRAEVNRKSVLAIGRPAYVEQRNNKLPVPPRALCLASNISDTISVTLSVLTFLAQGHLPQFIVAGATPA